jgi:hypothetical protein
VNSIVSNGSESADVLLDASGVVALFGGTVTERWVRDAGASGVLPSVKLGKFRRYRRSSVLDWLKEAEEGG